MHEVPSSHFKLSFCCFRCLLLIGVKCQLYPSSHPRLNDDYEEASRIDPHMASLASQHDENVIIPTSHSSHHDVSSHSDTDNMFRVEDFVTMVYKQRDANDVTEKSVTEAVSPTTKSDEVI